ncbi:MAG: undecaprenyldiphospho-muramoylpentapeptide beta-N-acetylglucosaminyltransferase [Spirochaetales bacterium]|nr:undecaprenyldiphospho-muramoylpentapeptide beta-N-acetylglucosaminyltransferase [Spirochaetales bacterium]
MGNTIIFTGGGTLGHVFPGLAVIDELKKHTKLPVIWLGSSRGMEKHLLQEKGIPFYGIPSGKFRRYFSVRNFMDIFKIIAGFFSSFFFLLKEKPCLLFSKGGYVSVPPVFAAFLLRIPVFTHECDYNPGLATKINARFAEKILVSFEETVPFFPDKFRSKIVLSGNPVRKEFLSGNPALGREILGIPEGMKTILILGGSQGARSINNAVFSIIDKLVEKCFIIHQTGKHGVCSTQHANYKAKSFFKEEFPHVLSAADLVISRAGANALWEITLAGKPSLLIPLPKSNSRGDQILNAALFEKNGVSQVIEQDRNLDQKLLEKIMYLIDNEKALKKMRINAENFLLPDSSVRISRLILERIGEIKQ